MTGMFAIRLPHVNAQSKMRAPQSSEVIAMGVLVAPAFRNVRRSTPLEGALWRWRLRFAIRAEWALLLRRRDPRLIAEAGIADALHGGGCVQQPLRQTHWML
ncbi:hypothetical protein A8M32_14830 [Sinorhizobium alkalisoli]|uniref:Uncharacterized protein n=1 Tax=Sinorhizobium alkalisoli TaxID=1752398 RepID=A0A1E3VAG5_9HYPH|nr:hypothetical protein A8M32_14830 [Sinorhizobium alkalisoli]